MTNNFYESNVACMRTMTKTQLVNAGLVMGFFRIQDRAHWLRKTKGHLIDTLRGCLESRARYWAAQGVA